MSFHMPLKDIVKNLGPFMFLILFYSIGASADDPIFSRFIEELTGDPFLIGILAALGWITYMVTAEPAGSITDKVGERKVILFGGILEALSFLIIFFSNSIYVFALALIIGGFGSALFWSAARTHIANFSRGKKGTAFGAFNASWDIGWSIGPLVGGLIALLNIRAPFLMAAILLTISVLIFSRTIPKDNKRSRLGKITSYELRGGFLRDGLNFFKVSKKGVKRILFMQVLMYSAVYIILIFGPLYFVNLNHAEIGAMFFIYAITSAFGDVLFGIISDVFRKPLFPVVGFLASGITILILLNSPSFIYAFVVMGAFGLALALIEPILDAMLNERVDHKTRGMANGLSQAAFGLGASAGPIAGGAIASYFGIPSSFLLATLICIIGSGIALTVRK